MVWNHEHVAQRAEQLEREGAREMRRLAEAKASAGPEHVAPVEGEILVADGGQQDRGPIDVGNHVEDREDPDATMVVVGLDTLEADAYELGNGGQTVADVNPGYPETDDVVEVVYPDRTDLYLDQKRYSFPRQRLETIARVHGCDTDV